MTGPLELAARVEAATTADNALDVLIEIALHEPTIIFKTVRANAAGTKVIYTDHDGLDNTCWADDWTMDHRRPDTIAALRARATNSESSPT